MFKKTGGYILAAAGTMLFAASGINALPLDEFVVDLDNTGLIGFVMKPAENAPQAQSAVISNGELILTRTKTTPGKDEDRYANDEREGLGGIGNLFSVISPVTQN